LILWRRTIRSFRCYKTYKARCSLEIIELLVFSLGSYLLGSISPAIVITRRVKDIDIRQVGSGHAGATNTMRAAGWGWGLLVMLFDIGKGFVVVWLALRWGIHPVLPGALAVIGHCWPVWAGFNGGMGMATAGGALAAMWPLGLVMLVGLGAALQLVVRHSARANIVTGILAAPLWWVFGAEGVQIMASAALGIIVALRAYSDWDREYRELWWDRPPEDS
jgi:glycerol-3-phosphate acyltransferase PlsY